MEGKVARLVFWVGVLPLFRQSWCWRSDWAMQGMDLRERGVLRKESLSFFLFLLSHTAVWQRDLSLHILIVLSSITRPG